MGVSSGAGADDGEGKASDAGEHHDAHHKQAIRDRRGRIRKAIELGVHRMQARQQTSLKGPKGPVQKQSIQEGTPTEAVSHTQGRRHRELERAVEAGLGRAVVFGGDVGLVSGMAIREHLGPSLQAASVVLGHSPASAASLSTFFFQNLTKVAFILLILPVSR